MVLLQDLTIVFFRISTLFDQFLSSGHNYVPAGDSIRQSDIQKIPLSS